MPPSLWQSIPDGPDLERLCMSRPEARRIPLNWTRREWLDEFNCICLVIVCSALREFDDKRGTSWFAFASWKIRNSLRDYYRLQSNSHQQEIVPNESLEYLIDQSRADEEHRKESRCSLAQALLRCEKRERRIICLVLRDGRTEKEVAKRLGKSQGWVSRKLNEIRTKTRAMAP